MKHFDNFVLDFHSCAPPVLPLCGIQCGSTPKPQRRGRDHGGRFSFVIFPAVWPFDQGRDRGVNRPEVTGDLSMNDPMRLFFAARSQGWRFESILLGSVSLFVLTIAIWH